MQEKAQMLLRWTERMRNPSADMVEFIGRDESLLEDDSIPDTEGFIAPCGQRLSAGNRSHGVFHQ